MARISYEEAKSLNSENQNQVGFFSLKSDGEEAIVRFMVDEPSDFNILTVHTINLDGKFRKINCIKGVNSSQAECPLCNSGVKVENRFYIPLIQYTKGDNGNIVAEAKIWERPFSTATLLRSYINEYGPLSKSIFKIKRQGKPGDMKTKYDIMYGNPQVYRDDVYSPVENAFTDYDVVGTIVLNKSESDINVYLQTGKFPENMSVGNNVDDVPFTGPSETVHNYNSQPGVPYSGNVSTPYGNYGNNISFGNGQRTY